MSNVVDRSKTGTAPVGTGEVRVLYSVNTPDYPVGEWIINPDLSALAGVAQLYWKLSGDAVVAMTQAERDSVDAAQAAAQAAALEAQLKDRILTDPLDDIAHSATVSGLTITASIEGLVADDETIITADPSLTKYVRLLYVYNSTADGFELQAFERTDGLYADLAADEYETGALGEWYVIAGGTELVEVT